MLERLHILWKLWRGRRDNPLCRGGVLLHHGSGYKRLANVTAWVLPWLIMAGAVMIPVLGGVARPRDAAQGVGILSAVVGPFFAVIFVPLVVFGFTSGNRALRRMEDLYITSLTRREAVFGTYLPAARAIVAVLGPFIAMGAVGAAMAWEGGILPTKDKGLVAGMGLGFPILTLWLFLVSLRMALRRQRITRWHLLLPVAEVLLLVVLFVPVGLAVALLGAAGVALAHRYFSWVPNGETPLAGVFIGGTLVAACLLTAHLLRSAFSHAGLWFYRELEGDLLRELSHEAGDTSRYWRPRDWGGAWRTLVAPGGFLRTSRRAQLVGCGAGIATLFPLWAGIAALRAVDDQSVDRALFRLRLQETVIFAPLPLLAGGVVASLVATALVTRRPSTAPALRPGSLRLDLAIRQVPLMGAFLLIAMLSWLCWPLAGSWVVRAGGLILLLVLGGSAWVISVLLASAYTAGRWTRVGGIVAVVVLLLLVVPESRLCLPMPAEYGRPAEQDSGTQLLVCLLATAWVCCLVAWVSLPRWNQRIFSRLRGLESLQPIRWRRWLAAGGMAILGGIVLWQARQHRATVALRSSVPLRELSVRFIEEGTGDPLHGIGRTGVTWGSPKATNAEGVCRWGPGDFIGARRNWPPGTPLAVYFQAGLRDPPFVCGSFPIPGPGGDITVSVPPRRVRLVSTDGVPLSGVEVQVLERIPVDAATPDNPFVNQPDGKAVPVACVTTDDDGVLTLDRSSDFLAIAPPLLFAYCPNCSPIRMLPIPEVAPGSPVPTLMAVSCDPVHATVTLAGGGESYPTDPGVAWIQGYSGAEERRLVQGTFQTSGKPTSVVSFVRVRRTREGGILAAPEAVVLPGVPGECSFTISEASDFVVHGHVRETGGRPAERRSIIALTWMTIAQGNFPGWPVSTGWGASQQQFRSVAPLHEDGSFDIPIPGSATGCSFRLSEDGDLESLLGRPDDRSALASRGKSFSAATLRASTDLVLVGPPRATCSGRLKVLDGRPARDARVGAFLRGREGWEVQPETRAADGEGRFRLPVDAIPDWPGEPAPRPWGSVLAIPSWRNLGQGRVVSAPGWGARTPFESIVLRATDGSGRVGVATASCNTDREFEVTIGPPCTVRLVSDTPDRKSQVVVFLGGFFISRGEFAAWGIEVDESSPTETVLRQCPVGVEVRVVGRDWGDYVLQKVVTESAEFHYTMPWEE